MNSSTFTKRTDFTSLLPFSGKKVGSSVSNFECDRFALRPRPAGDKTEASKFDLPEFCPRAVVSANPTRAAR